MSNNPAATRSDHQRFCEREGWSQVRNARGSTGTHHVTFELALVDGRILRTRVSHPVNRKTYGASIWAHILRDQLEVSAEDFWACVRDDQLPERGRPAQAQGALPLSLVFQLINRLGMSEEEVRGMTKDDAVRRLAELWSPDAGNQLKE